MKYRIRIWLNPDKIGEPIEEVEVKRNTDVEAREFAHDFFSDVLDSCADRGEDVSGARAQLDKEIKDPWVQIDW